MKELIEYIARGLASQPDDVKVTEEVEEDRVVFKLEVAAEDKGKIIGRQGRVAQAMRVLLRVARRKKRHQGSLGNRLARSVTPLP